MLTSEDIISQDMERTLKAMEILDRGYGNKFRLVPDVCEEAMEYARIMGYRPRIQEDGIWALYSHRVVFDDE